jgi:hypothetical protein
MKTSSARESRIIVDFALATFLCIITVSMRFQTNYAFPEYRGTDLSSVAGGTAQQLFNATIIVRIPEQPVRWELDE